jgi:hypothetical protein
MEARSTSRADKKYLRSSLRSCIWTVRKLRPCAEATLVSFDFYYQLQHSIQVFLTSHEGNTTRKKYSERGAKKKSSSQSCHSQTHCITNFFSPNTFFHGTFTAFIVQPPYPLHSVRQTNPAVLLQHPKLSKTKQSFHNPSLSSTHA